MRLSLINCDVCGVVLDLSKLEFPDTWDEEEQGYDGDSFILCPVCDNPIYEKDTL